jgi:hypothetical protein
MMREIAALTGDADPAMVNPAFAGVLAEVPAPARKRASPKRASPNLRDRDYSAAQWDS